ncbi:MAG: hypothetical protein Q4E51_08760 [Lachnospiraceae bacterium]|nr:hypothetical protein [Lachnospiraceae bacterium]
MIKELIAKFKEWNTIRGTICHYTAHFVTTDGVSHCYTRYRYGAPEQIRCSVPEYIMIDIKSDGYLKDDNGVMYPLQNVASISWECDDIVEGVALEEYRVFYDKPIDK